jgi:hypothetical protein
VGSRSSASYSSITGNNPQGDGSSSFARPHQFTVRTLSHGRHSTERGASCCVIGTGVPHWAGAGGEGTVGAAE